MYPLCVLILKECTLTSAFDSFTAGSLRDALACVDTKTEIYWSKDSLIIGNYIYETADSLDPLVGGDLWYKGGTSSLKVSDTGEILDKYNCEITGNE